MALLTTSEGTRKTALELFQGESKGGPPYAFHTVVGNHALLRPYYKRDHGELIIP